MQKWKTFLWFYIYEMQVLTKVLQSSEYAAKMIIIHVIIIIWS